MPSLRCSGCGATLKGESFAGPARDWFHTEGILSVVATRQGWIEGVCPGCQRPDGGPE